MRVFLAIKIIMVLLVASTALVAATIYYYYTSNVPISVETPKVEWQTGTDISATIGANSTWCQISPNVQPNATTVYTSALKFKVLSDGTVNLQIGSVTDSNLIIWGVRFYVFQTGASDYNLTLVNWGNVTVSSTDGLSPKAEVGYRQSGALSGYGGTTIPQVSGAISASADDIYVIVIEIYGKESISPTQSATIQLRLSWY
jgi:hypothetical protein